jgi:myo-inositol 2-dehydrogenase / D-chiro-inositol 1-dehydrogenase
MRIGLAGAGRIGAFHAGILSGLPAVDSVVVADADAARARAAGDVDTMAAVLTLDDDSLAVASSTRLQRRRLRRAARGARFPGQHLRRAWRPAAAPAGRAGATFPSGPAYRSFTDRFADAYRAELAAFAEFAEHGGQSPAAMSDALEAFRIAEACELSRARHEPVSVAEARR